MPASNLDQRIGTLESAIAKLIDFTVDSAAAASEKSAISEAPVRVAINGECVPVFDPSDPDGLKITEWLMTLGQLKDMHRRNESATVHYGTAKFRRPALV